MQSALAEGSLQAWDLAIRIGEAERRAEALRGQLRRTELLLELQDRWSARRAAQELRAASPEEPPDEVVQRIGTLRPEVDLLGERTTTLARQVADLEPAALAPLPDEALLPLTAAIAQALDGVSIQRQRLEEDLPKAEGGLRQAEALLAAALAPLGADWTEQRLAALNLGAMRAADLEDRAAGFEGLRQRRIQLETRRGSCAEALEEARAEVAARQAAGADLGWLDAEAEIRARTASGGTQRRRLDRLERLSAERHERAPQLEAVLARLGPGWGEEQALAFGGPAQWRRFGQEAAEAAAGAAEARRKGELGAEQAETQWQRGQDPLRALERPAATAAEAEGACSTMSWSTPIRSARRACCACWPMPAATTRPSS